MGVAHVTPIRSFIIACLVNLGVKLHYRNNELLLAALRKYRSPIGISISTLEFLKIGCCTPVRIHPNIFRSYILHLGQVRVVPIGGIVDVLG